MTKMTVAAGDDDALKQEHQMLMPLLFGPNEHVAVTDRSLQQGVRLCLLDAFIHTLNVFWELLALPNTSAVPWNKRLMMMKGSQTLIEVIYTLTGGLCVTTIYECIYAIRC